MTVFVRETAQNSWDARLRDVPVPTTYRLELTTVAPIHRPNWERLLSPPAETEAHLGVGKVVRTPDLRLLSVVDRGTKGLGGPTRADELATDRKDWVSFVLNVGEKRDTEQGGGTYGYGKAVLYRMSRVGTILVYTRTREADGSVASRLIGIALGESFDSRARVDRSSRPFTGRHWWGDVQGDHVEPLRGAEADSVARTLGLQPFVDDETGTTLVVLDPELDDFDESADAARHLAETIAWQLWPIMLPERGDDRLVPDVVAGGVGFTVPDPTELYPLELFVRAYRRQRDGDGTVLECGNPRRKLGRFAVEQDFVIPMDSGAATLAAECAGVPGDPHHVCLMRSPELVVRYHAGPETGSVNKAYAGVFRALDELDDVYAAAEPPTHDNWVDEQLSGHARTFVRVTFRRIRDQLDGFRGSRVATTRAGGGIALGAASSFLGGIVAAAFSRPEDASSRSGPGSGTVSGRGGAGTRGEGRRPSPAPRDRVRVLPTGEPVLDEVDGRVVLVQGFAVTGPGPVELKAEVSVGLGERSREDEAPAGADRPMVLHWTTAGGVHDGAGCVVDSPGDVELVVLPVADTVTDIAVVGTRVESTS
ncbi:hypothetical protein [Pseudonocardia spirodelae]|uniref:Uncharacterized protein n=1 Tax=Pseudonocardia spirodelae TaxID=3133431 RepID=A0ABU8TA89_9PSEU